MMVAFWFWCTYQAPFASVAVSDNVCLRTPCALPTSQSGRSEWLVAKLSVGTLTPRTFSSNAACSARVSCDRLDHSKCLKKNKTVIDKTAETRERLNRAASCLSLYPSTTHTLTRLPFLFHHCAPTNTPFWQQLNCADTHECVGQNGRLVKVVVVYTHTRIIRGGRFSEPINHEQALHLFDEYFSHRIDADGGKQFLSEGKQLNVADPLLLVCY